MKSYWRVRVAVFFVVLAAILYVTASITLLRDGILSVLMIYLVIGSVTGGMRRVLAQFTGRDIYHRRSGRLGYSWYALTMWIIRKLFGLTPPERVSKQDGE